MIDPHIDDNTNNFERLLNIESFPNVYQQIFSYLDVQSLNNASLVSTDWNVFIGGSSTLMQKICLGINMNNRKILESLINTSRKFRSVKIKFFFHTSDKFVCFMEKHRWTSIVLDSQFIKFPDLEPSCLKNLTSLKINTLELSHVLNILKSSSNLKHLKIVAKFCNRNDWSMNEDKKMQLESLEVSLSDYMFHKSRNFNDFLKTQTHLRRLDLSGISLDWKTMEIITKIPKLKCLVMRGLFYEYEKEDLQLLEMTSLQTLKLLDKDLRINRLFSTLINVCPNLKSLEVTSMNQTHIELAGIRLKKLLKLETTTLSFSDISNSDLFPELKIIKVKNPISLRFQRDIAEQVETKMTNFSLCLYEEIIKSPHIKVESDSMGDFIQIFFNIF